MKSKDFRSELVYNLKKKVRSKGAGLNERMKTQEQERTGTGGWLRRRNKGSDAKSICSVQAGAKP